MSVTPPTGPRRRQRRRPQRRLATTPGSPCRDGHRPSRSRCRRCLRICAGAGPSPTNTFDVVAAFDVIEHCSPERTALAGDAHRVLAPGGRFLMCCACLPDGAWTWVRRTTTTTTGGIPGKRVIDAAGKERRLRRSFERRTLSPALSLFLLADRLRTKLEGAGAAGRRCSPRGQSRRCPKSAAPVEKVLPGEAELPRHHPLLQTLRPAVRLLRVRRPDVSRRASRESENPHTISVRDPGLPGRADTLEDPGVRSRGAGDKEPSSPTPGRPPRPGERSTPGARLRARRLCPGSCARSPGPTTGSDRSG